MVRDFSEEDGFFRSDNFISNETSYLHIVDKLEQLGARGGAYIGVGPEQNFTYSAALQSKMTFVLDIRRQNMLEHLLYKALFELAPNRADFVSRLFSRKRPSGSTTTLMAWMPGFPTAHATCASCDCEGWTATVAESKATPSS